VDKSTLKCKSFDIDFDEETVEEISERFSELHKHLTENELKMKLRKQKI